MMMKVIVSDVRVRFVGCFRVFVSRARWLFLQFTTSDATVSHLQHA